MIYHLPSMTTDKYIYLELNGRCFVWLTECRQQTKHLRVILTAQPLETSKQELFYFCKSRCCSESPISMDVSQSATPVHRFLFLVRVCCVQCKIYDLDLIDSKLIGKLQKTASNRLLYLEIPHFSLFTFHLAGWLGWQHSKE